MKDLLGEEIIARHGCIGAVDDLYFDGDCRRTRVECGSGAWRAQAGRVADRVGPMHRAQRALYLRRTREDLRSSPSL